MYINFSIRQIKVKKYFTGVAPFVTKSRYYLLIYNIAVYY